MKAIMACEAGGKGTEIVRYELGEFPLSPSDFMDRRTHAVDVRLRDDVWRVEVDGAPMGLSDQDVAKAVHFAHQFIARKHEEMQREVFAANGLSSDKWAITGNLAIKSLDDPMKFLYPTATGWVAHASGMTICEAETALEAEKALFAPSLLSWKELDALEWAYAAGEQGVSGFLLDPDYHSTLVEKGTLASRETDNGTLFVITEQGREALDHDPRSLPLALREIIFEGAEKVGFKGDARRAWNMYVGTQNASNAKALVEALNDGLELSVGRADNEPYEVSLKGRGITASGAYVRDANICLFSPEWATEGESSIKLAEAIIEQADELAKVVQALLSKKPEPTESPLRMA